MQASTRKSSVDAYLARESASATRHEYVDGEIYAMSGASRRHNLLATNLLRHAANAAAARPGCQVFGGTMKVRVEARNSFYYPDVSGTCDADDRDERYLTRPCFIIEVLSPSTAAVDRREKRVSYATLPSLSEYLIVEQDRMRVTVYPADGGPWISFVLDEPQDVMEIKCIGLRFTLAQIYDGVELPAPGIAESESAEYAMG